MIWWKRADSWAIIAAVLTVFLFGVGNYWSSTWLSKWAMLLAIFVTATSVWAVRRTSWFYFPLILYVFLDLLAVGIWPHTPQGDLFDPVSLLAVQKNAVYGLFVWFACIVCFVNIRIKHAPAIIAALATVWFIGTFSVLAQPISGPHSAPNDGLWFGNPSIGGSLLACLLPFAWSMAVQLGFKARELELIMTASWIATFGAVLATGASVPWGVLGVVSAAVILAKSSKKTVLWSGLGVAGLGAAMVGLGKLSLGSTFWDQNGRFEIWQMAFDYFKAHAVHPFGMGFSTSQVLLPLEQINTGHFHGDYFIWLHNDWLQFALEGGILGAVCLIPALYRIATLTYKKPVLFGAFAGFAVMALFNYPLRMPVHSMALVLMCGMAEACAIRSPERISRKLTEVGRKIHSTLLSTFAHFLGSRSYSRFPEPSKSWTPSDSHWSNPTAACTPAPRSSRPNRAS